MPPFNPVILRSSIFKMFSESTVMCVKCVTEGGGCALGFLLCPFEQFDAPQSSHVFTIIKRSNSKEKSRT